MTIIDNRFAPKITAAKGGFLVAETVGGAVNMMRTIRRALDPQNITNPGKILTL